ncbi:Oxysterol-binding protein-related protein 2A, partial [Cucurbita argyrosperma subsp. argyrosperma]
MDNVEHVLGKTSCTLFGKWTIAHVLCKWSRECKIQRVVMVVLCYGTSSEPPHDPTRYTIDFNFQSLLNELTPGSRDAPSHGFPDSRPDQRHLERGEYDKAQCREATVGTKAKNCVRQALLFACFFKFSTCMIHCRSCISVEEVTREGWKAKMVREKGEEWPLGMLEELGSKERKQMG